MQAVAAETKIALLMAVCLVLVLGVLVSDLLTQAEPDSLAGDTGPLTRLGVGVQESLGGYRQVAAPEEGERAAGRLDAMAAVVQVEEGESIQESWDAEAEGGGGGEGAGARGGATLLLRHEPVAAAEEELEKVVAAGGADGVAAVTAEPGGEDPRAAVVSVVRHVVGGDETLTGIARRYYNDGSKWRMLARTNPEVGLDGRVWEGMTLVIPDAETESGLEFLTLTPEPILATPLEVPTQPTISVKSGDTLSGLAAEHLGSGSRWIELLEANRDRLDTPEDLRSGMTLRLPAQASPSETLATPADLAPQVPAPAAERQTYTVREGDNLTLIAAATLGSGDRWRDLLDANRDLLDYPEDLQAGQVLVIPEGAASPGGR